jgi:hypothetical protein
VTAVSAKARPSTEKGASAAATTTKSTTISSAPTPKKAKPTTKPEAPPATKPISAKQRWGSQEVLDLLVAKKAKEVQKEDEPPKEPFPNKDLDKLIQKRQESWEALLLKRPRSLKNRDSMMAWVQEVLRVSDLEDIATSESSLPSSLSLFSPKPQKNTAAKKVTDDNISNMDNGTSAQNGDTSNKKISGEKRKLQSDKIDKSSTNTSEETSPKSKIVEEVEEEQDKAEQPKDDRPEADNGLTKAGDDNDDEDEDDDDDEDEQGMAEDASTSSEDSVDLRVSKKPRATQ